MICQYLAGAIANVPGGVLVDTGGRLERNRNQR